MPRLIEIPGIGIAEFPDGTSDEVILNAIRRDYYSDKVIAVGAFDDLIPASTSKVAGPFDDLIPASTSPATHPQSSIIALPCIGIIAVLLMWALWRKRGRSRTVVASSQSAERYITSNCRLCGGSIEFPARGLGERVACPHCNGVIQLKKTAFVLRVAFGLRNWFQHNFGWKWATAFSTVILLCGTTLFIYLDSRAEARTQAALQAERLQRQQMDAILARLPAIQTVRKPHISRLGPSMETRQLRALESIESELQQANWDALLKTERESRQIDHLNRELRRANEIAERAASQRMFDQMHVPLTPIYSGAYAPNSLANPFGAGSPYKHDGLMNPYSQYGSPYSSKSWRNPYATDTPRLYDSQGNYRGKLSSNPYDADSVSNPYGRYGSPYSSESINNPYGLGSPYRSEPIYVVPSRP